MGTRREQSRGGSLSGRFLAGTAGLRLAGKTIWRRGAAGALGLVAGLGLLAHAVSSHGPRGLRSQDSVTVHRSVRIAAPRPQVFGFLQGLEHVPRILKHVRAVRPVGENRWSWIAGVPDREPVAFETHVTRLIPDRTLTWSSVAGSPRQCEGSLRFEDAWGGTRVRVRIAYAAPPSDGDALAERIFGGDPQRQVREDLRRLKAMVERGRTHGPRGTVLREEVGLAW